MKRAVSVGIEFSVALVALLAGVISIGLLCAHFGGSHGPNRQLIEQTPLRELLIAAFFVPMAETAVWTVVFVELAARLVGRAWIGAVLGAIAYGIGFHWSTSICGKLVATWLGLVTTGIYVYERKYNRYTAYACALCLRWSFVAAGIALSRSSL